MCNINYTELILNEKNVLDYALKFSDFFSIIVICKKPYSKIPPNFEYESVAKKLNPFLVKYIFDRNEWPVKYLSRSKHQVMVFYKSCKESRQIMSEQPNWFLSTQNNLPEDICFYRKEEAWLVTISHEKLAYITNPTKQDIAFLKQNNILYCEGSPMSQYKLPKELKSKCHNSIEDFLKYVLLEMQSPIEDYYIAIELLKNEYPKTKDVRIAVLGAYLSSTWLVGETNEFIKLLSEHLLEVDNQNKAIIYYLLAYDIYIKYDKPYPAEYSDFLQKSISYAQRFANNYIRLAEVTDSKEKDMLLEKAISNVETVWNKQELTKLSIDDFLTYEAFVDEFILGVSIGDDMYKKLVRSRNSK